MIKGFRLTVTALVLITCNAAFGQSAGEVFAEICETGGFGPGSLPINIGSICVGTGPLGADNLTVGRTTFNTPLSPIDNNSSGTVVTTSKDSTVDLVEDRRKAARKSGSEVGNSSETLQVSNLLGKIGVFANISRASGDRKNELIATQQIGSTTGGQDTLDDPETYINPATRSLGFSYDSTNFNAGVDFRLSRNFLAGLVLGYNERNTDQSDNAGYSKYKDTQLSLLFSYAADNGFYADALVGYGKGTQRYGREFSYTLRYIHHDACNYEEDHELCFDENNVTLSYLAQSKADSKNLTLAASTGFEIAMGRSTLIPFIRLESSKQTISDYRETAQTTNKKIESIEQIFIDSFLLHVYSHDIESTTASAGLEYNHLISTNSGVLAPKISLTSIHRLKAPKPVRASFLYNERYSFLTETPSLDDHHWNLGLSTHFVAPGGLMFYALAEKMLGHKQLDQWSWALGFRKEI